MKSEFSFRIKILTFCILAFSLILISRLFMLQVVHSRSYSKEANRQYVTPSSDIFERGTIFFQDKNGELVSAATQTLGFKLAIEPNKIKDIENVYKQLSTVIKVDREDLLFRASKKDDPYEEITGGLSKDQADQISTLKLSGVKLFQEKWRFYPGENMAAQSLGFVGYKDDSLGGRYGLEREYDSILSRGKDDPYVNFFAEVFSNISSTIFQNNVKKGDIVTTIEPNVVSFLDKELASVQAKYNTDSLGGIIMDPVDGSIFALIVKPDFNVNDFSKVKNVKTFSNPAVENVLEFGSVVKPLVIAAALDKKVITAETKYNDTGMVTVEKKQIYNFDKKGRGPGTTMQDVLNQSLNTGMVFAYQKLGKETFRDYMYAYGIKDKTEIDLPNETSGLTSNLKSPRELEYANAAFGQGIALTPIGMVRALASLGNGGNLVTPHLVDRIIYEDNSQKKLTTKPSQLKFPKKLRLKLVEC